jgi:integrase
MHLVKDFEKPDKWGEIEDWLESLLSPENIPRALAPKTVRIIAHTMSKLFRFGIKKRCITLHPFSEKRIRLPRGCTKRVKEPTQITPTEFSLLMSHLEIREKLAGSLAGFMSLRANETFGLRWQDTDFESNKVCFRQGSREGRISDLKTAGSRTEFPIPLEVVELLIQWKALTPYSLQSDWVFASPHTKGQRPYSPKTLLRNIQHAARLLGLPHLGWHTFRHSSAAWAKELGMSPEEIKTLLRHQTLKMGDDYGRVGFKKKQQILKKLSGKMKKSAGKDSKLKRSIGSTLGKIA